MAIKSCVGKRLKLRDSGAGKRTGLSTTLNRIGNEITVCRNKCEGIKNEPGKCIYPRCFYPEKKSGHFDYIVIGINPGYASDLERAFTKFIKSHKRSFGFNDIRKVAKPIIEGHDYYERVRKFLGKLSNKKNPNITLDDRRSNFRFCADLRC